MYRPADRGYRHASITPGPPPRYLVKLLVKLLVKVSKASSKRRSSAKSFFFKEVPELAAASACVSIRQHSSAYALLAADMKR